MLQIACWFITETVQERKLNPIYTLFTRRFSFVHQQWMYIFSGRSMAGRHEGWNVERHTCIAAVTVALSIFVIWAVFSRESAAFLLWGGLVFHRDSYGFLTGLSSGGEWRLLAAIASERGARVLITFFSAGRKKWLCDVVAPARSTPDRRHTICGAVGRQIDRSSER